MSLGFQMASFLRLFILQTTQQTFGSHLFNERVSQKFEADFHLPEYQSGLKSNIPHEKGYHAHTFHARIPHCSVLDAVPSSGCFIPDQSSARAQHVGASWTLLRLFGRIFPNQCPLQQWSLAVRDGAALLRRRHISLPISPREDTFISEEPQLADITASTGAGVRCLRRVGLAFHCDQYTNTRVCSCLRFD